MKKKQWINNRIKQVEEAHKRNDTRKFFKDIRALQNDDLPLYLPVKMKMAHKNRQTGNNE